MNIAQILYHTCPLASEEGKESGGANVYVLKLSEELSRVGIQVDMFTRSEDQSVPHILEINPNLRLFHLNAGPEKTLPKEELINYIPEFVENLSNYMSQQTYDILDCHYYLSGLAGLSLIHSLQPTPYNLHTIITFHTLGLIKNLVARSPSEFADETRIQTEKKLVKKFDQIIAPSKNEADYLHYLYGASRKKIQIISPGYDENIFRPTDKIEAKRKIQASPKHKIVLFVGRIEPLKGIDSLLYATKIAFEKYHTQFCVFVIGGEKNSHEVRNSNGTMEKLNKLRHELNLHSSVKFINQVTQNQLSDYYNASDVVVVPSHYESFGITALEAMACETPVVMTNIAGVSGILNEKHQDGVIAAGNPLLLAEKIHQIISNETYHDKISREIKKTIEKLTWGQTANEVIKIYQKLTKQQPLNH